MLNLRFSDFYSADLFKCVKEKYQLRLVAVVDQYFKDRIGEHISRYLDEIYSLQAHSKDGFLAEFDFHQLCEIVEKEMRDVDEIKLVCTDEFNLLNTGHLRRKYKLAGNTDSDLIPFRDKIKMKQLLQTAHIRTPHFKLLEKHDDFDSLSKSIGLPFVIKPIDSCGSFGVHIIRKATDYLNIIDQLKNATAQFEVEEYIEGKLYHVDSCMQNNAFVFICANEYSWPNHDYTQGKALGSIPLKEKDLLRKKLINFAQQALVALGSKNLINHMEIFVTKKQELVFLEVSARPPGGLLNLVHQINFAVNLMDLDFFMQTGLSAELSKIEKKENAFWSIFPLLPGKIVSFQSPKIQSRVDIQYFRNIGDSILSEECNSIVGKVAHAVFYHESEDILYQDFEYIRHFSLAEMEK